jgi:hypothetical protein
MEQILILQELINKHLLSLKHLVVNGNPANLDMAFIGK